MGIQLIIPPASVTIPNGTIINGVAHFVQPTNPATRSDGSPLVTGDRNRRTDLKVDAFWTGMYWAEAILRSTLPAVYNSGAAFAHLDPLYLHNPGTLGLHGFVLIEKVGILNAIGASMPFGNSSNYKIMRFGYYNNNSSNIIFHSVNSHELPSTGYQVSINLAAYIQGFNLTEANVGATGNVSVRSTIFYRNIFL